MKVFWMRRFLSFRLLPVFAQHFCGYGKFTTGPTLCLLAALFALAPVPAGAEPPRHQTSQTGASDESLQLVGSAFVRLTSARHEPDGKWLADLEWGRRNGLTEAGQGWYYRYAAGEAKGAPGQIYLAGKAKVVSLGDQTTVVEIALDQDAHGAPAAGDSVELPLRLPRTVYNGLVLTMARLRIALTSNDGAAAFTDMGSALALHSVEDENAVLSRMAAEVRSIPASLPDLPVLAQTIEAGFYARKTLGAAMRDCTGEDVASLLLFIDGYPGKYIENTFRFAEVFGTWALNGAPETRKEVERRAQGISADEDLVRYFKNVVEQEQLLATLLFPWFDAANAAASGGDSPAVQFHTRLLRAAGAATGRDAYSVAAQIVEAELLVQQKKQDEALIKLKAAVEQADLLPDDPAFDSEKEERDDVTRTYWKARALFHEGFLVAGDHTSPVAPESAFEAAAKLLEGHSHSPARTRLESVVLHEDAAAQERAGKLERAHELYLRARDAFRRRGDATGRDNQAVIAGELESLADLYAESGNKAAGAAILEALMAEQRVANDLKGLARLFTRLAFLYLKDPPDKEKSRNAADEAVRVADASKDAEARALAHEARAAYYLMMDDESKARDEYKVAAEDARSRNDVFRVAWYTWKLGGIAEDLQDTVAAAQSYAAALDSFRAQKLPYWVAQVLLSIGYLDYWQGAVEDARKHLQESRDLAKGFNSQEFEASQYMLEGKIYHMEGRIQEAVASLRHAQGVWKQTSNTSGQLGVLIEIGNMEHDQREMEEALKTWQEVISLGKGFPADLAIGYGNLSLSLLRLGRLDEADEAARQAIAVADSIAGQPYLPAEVRGAWAVHLLERARRTDDPVEAAHVVDDATRYLNAAEIIARRHNVERTILRVLFGQGRRMVLLAERPELTNLVTVQPSQVPPGEANPLDGAIERANKLGDLEYQWESLFHRGVLCAWKMDYPCATRDLEASTAMLCKQAERYAVLGGGGASRFQADKQRPFLELLKFYQAWSMDLKKQAANSEAKGLKEDAAQAEKDAQEATGHARDVLDRLRRFEMQTSSPGLKLSAQSISTQEVVAAYQRRVRQEQELDRRLAEEKKREPQRAGVIPKLQEELSQLRTQVDKEAQLIRQQYPSLAKDLELDPENPDAFVKALNEDEALVEPVLTADRLIVFVARSQRHKVSVWSFTSEVNSKQFEGDLTTLWKAVSDPGSKFDPEESDQPGALAHVAAELYDWLFASAEPRLEGVKTVLLSATGRLRYVPFHVLLAPGPDGKRIYLNDRYNIVYLTRKGIASGYAPGATYRGAPVVAVANPSKDEPLPEADEEVVSMQKIWKTAAPAATFEIRQHDGATTLAVSGVLQKVSDRLSDSQIILHIATHGQAGALPQDSFLLFADGKVPQDELREKLGLRNANISLAVLSGCETAYRQSARTQEKFEGLGVTGLAYGFEDAGVKTVLGTLWKLDSETGPLFMQSFYKQLSDGASAASALSLARQELRKKKPHPFYWAPFVVIGQWR